MNICERAKRTLRLPLQVFPHFWYLALIMKIRLRQLKKKQRLSHNPVVLADLKIE
jgi:hypothetical protein